MRFEIYNKLSESAIMIREKVFVEEQGFQNELDDIDNIACHIVMFKNDNPIAVCRVFESQTKDTYILGRLAVLKEFRGQNIGAEMIKYAEKVVIEKGGKQLSLHSQYRVKDFYSKLGFIEYGDIDYDEDCPHIWMTKRL